MNETVIGQEQPAGLQGDPVLLADREEDHAQDTEHETVGDITVDSPRITCRNVDVAYGEKLAIKNVSIDIGKNEVIAMIGPSGCGKSTFLRCLNRMNDVIESCRVSGSIKLDDHDIYGRSTDVVTCPPQAAMVSKPPTPFPRSFSENVPNAPAFLGLPATKTTLATQSRTIWGRPG